MPETIYKLQPNRTVHLRGFSVGSAAALHSAGPTGFTVSGVFGDPAHFAVLILFDADNFFEHPRMKYLPDFDFSGMVLSFDVLYSKLQPLDSQKFPTIDWPFLDGIRPDGTTFQIPLFDHAASSDPAFTAATGSFTIVTPGCNAFDRVSLWFQNIAFDFIASGGESASDVAAALTAQINNLNWLASGGAAALWAHQANAAINIVYARYGRVLTNGKSIVLTGGQDFAGLRVGDAMRIGTVETSITAIASAGVLTVADDFGAQSLLYLAARGGYDGNMVRMYALSKNGNLTVASSTVQFAGGGSAAVWHISLDFTALGIDQVRQMFLTFAPRLTDSTAYVAEEWDAVFSNWAVVDPNGKRPLQVAAQNSVRVDDSASTGVYTGSSWTLEAGFYSQGFARRASAVGDSVSLVYDCQVTHDLWLGTSLYVDRGQWGVVLDGDAETLTDCYLAVEPAVVTRRKVRAAVPAGRHSVVLTVRGPNPLSSGGFTYLDFIEAVVAGDVATVPDLRPTVSPALDYDTDHTYKLSPQRLLWTFDTLGWTGPMNEYLGVFWWNQRRLAGCVFPTVVVTFGGSFVDGDQIFLAIGGTTAGKTVFPADSLGSIATHLAYFINETFSGVWAVAAGAVLTITSRSAAAAYNFTFVATKVSAAGTMAVTGSLTGGVLGSWVIDPLQDPPLNYAIRKWHANFYSEVAARSRTVVTACSMELVNPPGGYAALFLDGQAVTTSTGFASLLSTQCAPMASAFLAYQKRVYIAIAKLQADNGLTPELQFGEFLWWFFSNSTAQNPNGGMAFYDAETVAAASSALGHALHAFIFPDDDPAAYAADATFLANRLAAHVEAIRAAVAAVYPACKFELLWPADVNAAKPTGVHGLGGRLNAWVNLPVAWQSKAASGLDRFKMEALDWGAGTRSLDLALAAIQYPLKDLSWPLDSIRYLFPVFNGGCPWEAEYLLAVDEQIPAMTPFALDHMCLFGWRVEEPVLQPQASLL